jgi:hypothetical protein
MNSSIVADATISLAPLAPWDKSHGYRRPVATRPVCGTTTQWNEVTNEQKGKTGKKLRAFADLTMQGDMATSAC